MGRESRGQEWALHSGMGWEIQIKSPVRMGLRLKKTKITLRIIKHWGRMWTFCPWRFSRHNQSMPCAFHSELNMVCAGGLSRDFLKPIQPQKLGYYLISYGLISLVCVSDSATIILCLVLSIWVRGHFHNHCFTQAMQCHQQDLWGTVTARQCDHWLGWTQLVLGLKYSDDRYFRLNLI